MKLFFLFLICSFSAFGQGSPEKPKEVLYKFKQVADSLQRVIDNDRNLKVFEDTGAIYTKLDDRPRIPYKITKYFYDSLERLQKVIFPGNQGPISFYFINDQLALVQLEIIEKGQYFPVKYYLTKEENEASVAEIKEFVKVNPANDTKFKLLIQGMAQYKLFQILH